MIHHVMPDDAAALLPPAPPRILRATWIAPMTPGAGLLRAVSYGEVLGMAGRMVQFAGRFASAVDSSLRSPFLHIGIEPHAPYSLELSGYRRCAAYAKEHNLPITTHLAETPDESRFLA